jgi:hypothetical protein
MNERIKLLAYEAEDYADGIVDQGGEFHPAYTKKFAELIVGECMAMCKTSVGNADYNTGRLHCLNNIKEHFGVEE